MAKFEKGQSGNLKGRPAGRTAGARLRKAIEERADDLLGVVIDMAMAGDLAACSLLLSRIVAPLKATAPHVELPDASAGKGLAEQGSMIVSAAMVGQISPDVAGQLLSALASQARIVETIDLLARVEALENKNEQPKTAS